MLPHPRQPPTLGHIWTLGSPSYSALGMSPPSDTITRIFNHMLLAWPTSLPPGCYATQTQSPFLLTLAMSSWIISGLRGLRGQWPSDSQLLGPEGGD